MSLSEGKVFINLRSAQSLAKLPNEQDHSVQDGSSTTDVDQTDDGEQEW